MNNNNLWDNEELIEDLIKHYTYVISRGLCQPSNCPAVRYLAEHITYDIVWSQNHIPSTYDEDDYDWMPGELLDDGSLAATDTSEPSTLGFLEEVE